MALIPRLQQLLQDTLNESMTDIQCLLFSEEKVKEHDPLGVLVAEVVFIRHRFWAQKRSLGWSHWDERYPKILHPQLVVAGP